MNPQKKSRKPAKDSKPAVAAAAGRAVAAHTSQSPGTTKSPINSIPFWENPKAKLKGLLALYALEFILTLPLSIFALLSPEMLATFPLGLVYLFFPKSDPNIFMVEHDSYNSFGWLLYMGISIAIMISNNKNIVRVLFIVLTIMLLVNAGGCRAMGSGFRLA